MKAATIPLSRMQKLDYSNTHRELVEGCQRGERRAQYELYRNYSRAMYNLCLRMLKHEQDAEDILQASFVDVFTKISSYRHEASVGAWIKRICINNCINFLKRKRLLTEELDTRYHQVPEGKEPEPPLDMRVEDVQRAMHNLPDGYRVVFSLYAMEGYDHQEIGEILGISESTSKSQYCRARKKIKEYLIAK